MSNKYIPICIEVETVSLCNLYIYFPKLLSEIVNILSSQSKRFEREVLVSQTSTIIFTVC